MTQIHQIKWSSRSSDLGVVVVKKRDGAYRLFSGSSVLLKECGGSSGRRVLPGSGFLLMVRGGLLRSNPLQTFSFELQLNTDLPQALRELTGMLWHSSQGTLTFEHLQIYLLNVRLFTFKRSDKLVSVVILL